MKSFRAPWGKPLTWMSAGATALLLGLPIWQAFSMRQVISWPLQIPLVWLPPVVLLCAAPFVVRGYVITAEALLIRRLWWHTRISLHDLDSVEFIPNVMTGAIRTCGNGGLFSFTGWYWSRELRGHRAFVTDFNRTVVLRFKSRTIVVSPDDPEAFVKAASAVMLRYAAREAATSRAAVVI